MKYVRKRVCIVSLENIFAVPYLKKYTEVIDCDYDIVYWDRRAIENEECGATNYFVLRNVEKPSIFNKLFNYIVFKNYAQNVLNINKYDAVIVLHSQAAVMLKNILIRKYRNRFIFDIRDYSWEKFKYYYKAEEKLLKYSGLAVISSRAFQKFLPKHEYCVTHNTAHISKDTIKLFRNAPKKIKNRIVISCIGGIRFYKQFKKVISIFADDCRFTLRFIGVGAIMLSDFIENNHINNVELTDQFKPEETLKFYFDTDIIMNLYGNKTPLLDYAISNKLYYAAQLGIPILVSPGTYMEDVAVGNGFGFAFDLEERTMRDKLYEYYNSIKWDLFYKNCDRFMTEVYAEEKKFSEAIRMFLNTLSNEEE